MNSFGKLFRVSIFGESHGESVGIVVDGCPAGLALTVDDLLPDLERRKGGKQKGTTPRQEADYPFFKSGLFKDKTTGFPIAIFFENNNTRSEDYNKQRSIPRPGHADWVAHQKFGGHEDYRGGGHFSARLTTGLVAAGAIAKKLIIKAAPNTKQKITSRIVDQPVCVACSGEMPGLNSASQRSPLRRPYAMVVKKLASIEIKPRVNKNQPANEPSSVVLKMIQPLMPPMMAANCRLAFRCDGSVARRSRKMASAPAGSPVR